MNRPTVFLLILGASAVVAGAQSRRDPEPPVPIVDAVPEARRTPPAAPAPESAEAPGTPAPATFPAAGQRLYSPGVTVIPPDHAAQIVEEFRSAYDRLDRPRMVIYVNRELVEDRDGLRLTGRKEHVERERDERSSTHEAAPASAQPQTQVNVAVSGNAGAGSSAAYGPGEMRGSRDRVTADNSYERIESPQPSLADRQTVRDIERLFGRPLRIAGAQVADQRVVASLIADRPLEEFLATGGSDAARKDREALNRIADVVIEVLVSTRSLTIPGYTSDETRTVPDIQATAIRLSDGAIIGQASATDVLGRDRDAGPIVRQFEVRDIAEATALALMDDISRTAPAGS